MAVHPCVAVNPAEASTEATVSGPVPAFDTVTARPGAVVLIDWPPNSTCAGVATSSGVVSTTREAKVALTPPTSSTVAVEPPGVAADTWRRQTVWPFATVPGALV